MNLCQTPRPVIKIVSGPLGKKHNLLLNWKIFLFEDDLDKALIVAKRSQSPGQPLVLNLQVSTEQHQNLTSIGKEDKMVGLGSP